MPASKSADKNEKLERICRLNSSPARAFQILEVNYFLSGNLFWVGFSAIFDYRQYWATSWTKLIFDDNSVPMNMTTKRIRQIGLILSTQLPDRYDAYYIVN